MNVNKKLDRFKQWAGERMGGEVKTSVSDDFRSLEQEMELRQDGKTMPLADLPMSTNDKIGMDKMHKASGAYLRALSKRNESNDKEKVLPVAHMGGVMISHGEDFEADSDYGRCLISE